jgi:lipoprotein-anchoring transpeptidase ErfK/SrfK
MRDYRRLRFFCIVALAVALVVVAIPSARGATASEVLVDKSFHITLLRTVDGTLAFPNATGTTGESATPVGTYKVTEKQANPKWHWEGKVYAPYIQDKANGLGIRWIGISLPSYGLHGTNEPFSIGKDVSHGCVRHQNTDVTKAFPMIPTGTSVRVIETPIPQQTEGMVTDFLELYDLLSVMRGSH